MVAYLHPNEVGANFQQSLLDLVLADKGELVGEVRDVRSSSGGIPHARNLVMKELLESDHEWLFMVDADMGFRSDALAEAHLVADAETRPIIGGLCFAQRELQHDGLAGYRWHPRPTIFDYVQHSDGLRRFTYRQHYEVNALAPCAATGAAMLLIHRTVGEKVLNRFGPVWFDRIPDCDGGYMSEDISFFARCMVSNQAELAEVQAGTWDGTPNIPLHVFTGLKTNHLKPTWMAEDGFWSDFVPWPATETVDVIVPVLHRPQNVRPFMETLRASTGLATAWFVCESGDREQMAAVREHGGRVIQHSGSFAKKVNYAYRRGGLKAPWVFLVGDDVQFHAGWLDHAQFMASVYNGHVVGTNDLGNKAVVNGDHATHMLIRRSYVDEVGSSWDGPGVVCHEGYRHWFVDNEIVLAAKRRRVWQMALGSKVEHMHHLWGKALVDDVYELGQSFAEDDKVTFLARMEATAA
jgi:hypothetical protein